MAGEHLPPISPRWWEATLRRALDAAGAPDAFRIVRAEGRRAIAEVAHRSADRARSAWNSAGGDGGPAIATRRTWGTLRGAKAWLRRPGP